jgi:hypothetical protein
MKKKSFLFPTRAKVLSTLIILAFVFAGTLIFDIVGDLLVPADLMEFLNQSALTDILAERQQELVSLSVKILAVGALIQFALIYLSVCITFHYFKNE